MNQNLSNISVTELAPLVAAVGGVCFGLAGFWVAFKQDKSKIQFEVVFKEQFLTARNLYVRVTRLIDAVCAASSFQNAPEKNSSNLPEMLKLARGVRRCIRQDDVLYPQSISTKLHELLSDLEILITDFTRSINRDDEDWIKQRTELLSKLEDTRTNLQPYIRTLAGT